VSKALKVIVGFLGAMHVLFIGLDRGLFDEKSGDSVKRHKAYARALSRVTSIVFTRASEGFKRKSFGNFVVVPTNSVSRASFVHDAYRIASDIISKERIDVVSTQDPFVTGLIGVLLKRKYGIRLNVQVHTDITSAFWRSESMLNRVYSVLSRRVLKAADSVRVVNMKTFNFLRKSFPGKKVFFVPIATDVKFWRLRKDYKFRKRVIMVSRLSREKNLLMLVSAMKSVVASHPGTECVMVGEGP